MGCKRLVYVGTSYETIRDFIQQVEPQSNDVVYDLGCGYGRVVLYGALVTEAQWRGVDIVPHRIAEAQGIKEKFKIDNAQFRLGNVADQDFSDGTIFYLFDPFEQSILETVARRLEEIAKVRKIRVVSLYKSSLFLEKLPWLHDVHQTEGTRGIFGRPRFFESR